MKVFDVFNKKIPPEEQFEKLIDSAREKLNNDNYLEALKDLELAESLNIDNLKVHFSKGITYFYMKDYEKSIKLLDDTLNPQNNSKLNSELKEIVHKTLLLSHYALAYKLFNDRNLDASIDHCIKANKYVSKFEQKKLEQELIDTSIQNTKLLANAYYNRALDKKDKDVSDYIDDIEITLQINKDHQRAKDEFSDYYLCKAYDIYENEEKCADKEELNKAIGYIRSIRDYSKIN